MVHNLPGIQVPSSANLDTSFDYGPTIAVGLWYSPLVAANSPQAHLLEMPLCQESTMDCRDDDTSEVDFSERGRVIGSRLIDHSDSVNGVLRNVESVLTLYRWITELLKQREIGSKQQVTVAVNDLQKIRIIVSGESGPIYNTAEKIRRQCGYIPIYRANGYSMTTGTTSLHHTHTCHTHDPHTHGVAHTHAIP